MSYTPTNWQTGDTITAEKLNNMESGIENANNPFIVTLTPTAQDFSGTMDKTVAEINAAYEAGQDIWFKVLLSATEWTEVPTQAHYDATYSRCSFAAYAIDNGRNILLLAATPIADGSLSTYSTTIYPLTPMS